MLAAKKRNEADSYLRLVKRFPLRRLRSAKEHDEANKIFTELTPEMNSGKADKGTCDYVDVLVDLIVAYEKRAGYQIDTSHITPADSVRFLIEERGMSVNALARELKMSQSALNDMLNGKRGFSKSAIIKLSDYFKLNPAMFLRAK